MKKELTYYIERISGPKIKIDGDWDKPEWRKQKAVSLESRMGTLPKFSPKTEAKIMYDEHHIYGIFRVKDRFVRSTVAEINGNVSGDSCVEFFFSPDPDLPERYFNLEINAGGTPLIFYITSPWDRYVKLEAEDIGQIKIAHSMPAIIEPEISDAVIWTIEYSIPLSLLEKFSKASRPGPGVVWKANFYKTGSLTSNPHYFTWSPVDNPQPNFHLPEFFGTLIFK